MDGGGVAAGAVADADDERTSHPGEGQSSVAAGFLTQVVVGVPAAVGMGGAVRSAEAGAEGVEGGWGVVRADQKARIPLTSLRASVARLLDRLFY